MSWRKRIRLDNSLHDEKEKEIQELKELWHIDPSIVLWDELLARYTSREKKKRNGYLTWHLFTEEVLVKIGNADWVRLSLHATEALHDEHQVDLLLIYGVHSK